MRPLSVIITTLNEADNIAAVMASVAGADEILVIDSFSEDDTRLIAEKNGATVLQRQYLGPADQKNWAIPQARNEWVLILDADERVSPQLWAEIQQVLSKSSIEEDGFWINRQNYFMGQKINYSGWQGDAVIRLIKRDVCRYDDKQVHEEIMTEGVKIARLSQKMDHYTFKKCYALFGKNAALWRMVGSRSSTKNQGGWLAPAMGETPF